MKSELIERYAIGGKQLQQAISGLTREELLAVPIPGKWSTHVVVIHLADAEAALADRMRRLIAMDNPTLLSWDENQFLKCLHYDQQSAEDAAALVDLTRRQITRVLKVLPASAFARAGQHNELGRQTLEDVLTAAVNHLEHHLKFIAQKRTKLGK